MRICFPAGKGQDWWRKEDPSGGHAAYSFKRRPCSRSSYRVRSQVAPNLNRTNLAVHVQSRETKTGRKQAKIKEQTANYGRFPVMDAQPVGGFSFFYTLSARNKKDSLRDSSLTFPARSAWGATCS